MPISKPFVYLTPGFHSDVVWLEDQRDYAEILMSNLEQNLAICRFDPDYGFFIHELTYVKPYLDTHPEDRDFIRQLIKEGRIGTGGSHSQPSETLISGEGIIRNVLYGRLYHEGILGDLPEIYMAWDVFGHSAQLAQILAKSRFKGCIWSKDIRGAQAVFWHQALDGTTLLFKRMPYWISIHRDGAVRPAETEEELEHYLHLQAQEMKSLGLSADARLDTADFKPPTAWLAGQCGRLKRKPDSPIFVSGTAHRQWFREAEKEIREKKLNIPVMARDFEWHHQGTGLTRTECKIANRLAENTLINAEKFATIACYLGARYPDKALDKAWRQILFNQHHDAMTGTMCDRAYLDVMLAYREALELSSECLRKALQYIAEGLDTAQGLPVAVPPEAFVLVVFNPLNWKRDDAVCTTLRFKAWSAEGFKIWDAAGQAIKFQVETFQRRPDGTLEEASVVFVATEVPSLGYKCFYVVPDAGPLPTAQERGGNIIENQFYRITADPDRGGLISIFDKGAGKEIVNRDAGLANEIVALEEKPDRNEPAWEVYTTGVKYFSRDYAAAVRVRVGPVASRIIITGEMKDGERYQTVTLYEGVPRIDFNTRLENYRGQHHLYTVTFPVSSTGSQPVFEERFGALLKRKSKGKLDFRVHQWRNFSDCGARRTHQWIDYSFSGKIQFSDGKAVALGMIHLVTPHHRAAQESGYRIQERLIKKGIPCTPTFDDHDWERRKRLPMEDSILPGPEDFNFDLKYGTSFRISLDIHQTNRYTAKILAALGPEVRESFVKRLAKEGSARLFSYDAEVPAGWEPLPVLLLSAQDESHLARVVENLFKDFPETATLSLAPEERVSSERFELENYGVALLNQGTLLNSVERDGTLVLFLMHTAAWGYTPWGKDRLPFFLVPEWRSQNFFYALYPHTGSWREAQTYRRGFEFNNPLLALQTPLHKGNLPRELSFLELQGDSLVLTALKPASNATAAFKSQAVDVTKGMILRFYEAEGKNCAGTLTFFNGIDQAEATNLLEEPLHPVEAQAGALEVTAHPFAIETYRLIPKPWPTPGPPTPLAREKEPTPIIHFKHWEHNQGAEPLGYSPVSISLAGRIREKLPFKQAGVTVAIFQVAVANNLMDRPVRGKVEFLLPEQWRTVPEVVEYELPPLGYTTRPVLLTLGRWHGNRQGIIKARLEHDGQIYQDLLEVGGPFLLEWQVHHQGHKVLVEIRNPHSQAIEGEVALVSPLETWPGEEVGPYALMEVRPRVHDFEVAPQGRTQLEFRYDILRPEAFLPKKGFWLVAKLMYHGKVDYLPVPATSVWP